MTFDGHTYDDNRDRKRLTTEFNAVKTILMDGEWHTLPELFARTGYPATAALGSRIRDLRKEKFGGYNVESRCVNGGVWAYRVLLPEPVQLELV